MDLYDEGSRGVDGITAAMMSGARTHQIIGGITQSAWLASGRNAYINRIPMKKNSSIQPAFIVLFFFSIIANNSFATGYHIAGSIKGHDNQWIYLSVSVSPAKLLTDSVKIIHETFTFKGEIKESAPAFMMIGGSDEKLELFLDNTEIEVKADEQLSAAAVSGGGDTGIYANFMQAIAPFRLTEKDIALDSVYEAAKDTANLRILYAAFDRKQQQRMEIGKRFVQKYADSRSVAYALIVYFGDQPFENVRDLVASLSPRMQDSGYGKYLQRRVARMARTAVGQKAEDFLQNDINGNPVSLNTFKGKYLLVDFWASWCQPCRLNNPHLSELYQKYHALGFNILSVGMERPDGRKAWLDAIEQDHLVWTNVTDFNYMKNEVAVRYGIAEIPANLLLDRDGTIIGRNLDASLLEKKLATLFHENK